MKLNSATLKIGNKIRDKTYFMNNSSYIKSRNQHGYESLFNTDIVYRK